VVAVIASLGLFLFKQYTRQSITTKSAALERSRAAFEPATIKELSHLNTRIETATKLLAAHPALSNLFDELEKKTLSSVRFSNFSYAPAASDGVALSLSGAATGFNAVALQSTAFSESSLIVDPIFSDVNIGALGVVNFHFSAQLNSGGMRYVPAGAAVPDEPPAATP